MRYRVVIEVDAEMKRETFNKLAKAVTDEGFGFKPLRVVFLSTEEVNLETITDKRYVDN